MLVVHVAGAGWNAAGYIDFQKLMALDLLFGLPFLLPFPTNLKDIDNDVF